MTDCVGVEGVERRRFAPTPEQVEAARALLLAGAGYRAVAELWGVNLRTATHHINARGLTGLSPQLRRTERTQEIERRLAAGEAAAAIARDVGLSRGRVSEIAARAGIGRKTREDVTGNGSVGIERDGQG